MGTQYFGHTEIQLYNDANTVWIHKKMEEKTISIN